MSIFCTGGPVSDPDPHTLALAALIEGLQPRSFWVVSAATASGLKRTERYRYGGAGDAARTLRLLWTGQAPRADERGEASTPCARSRGRLNCTRGTARQSVSSSSMTWWGRPVCPVKPLLSIAWKPNRS